MIITAKALPNVLALVPIHTLQENISAVQMAHQTVKMST